MKINYTLLKQAFEKEPAIGLIGQSGAGKGLMQKLIIETYNELFPKGKIFTVESGLLLRETIPKMSKWNREKLKDRQLSGKLQSWLIATALWVHRILKSYRGGPILFDGSPRSIPEVDAVAELYHRYAGKEIIVFVLDISDELAIKRMKKRNDELAQKGEKVRQDTIDPEALKAKLAFYHESTVPALDLLKTKLGCYVYHIDASYPPAVVKKAIFSALITFHSK
ncbi:MAG: hypothetical protein JWL92_606 [Candidatus Nomurabacteria bacterium]|nr:hypothetical protein [Candidatus Nomurabacteria bacterium]